MQAWVVFLRMRGGFFKACSPLVRSVCEPLGVSRIVDSGSAFDGFQGSLFGTRPGTECCLGLLCTLCCTRYGDYNALCASQESSHQWWTLDDEPVLDSLFGTWFEHIGCLPVAPARGLGDLDSI